MLSILRSGKKEGSTDKFRLKLMNTSNEEIRLKTNIMMKEITQHIKRRRWKLIGHVLRKSVNENTRITLTWTQEERRKRGRPKETWRTWVQRLDRSRYLCERPRSLKRENRALFPSEGKGQDDDDEWIPHNNICFVGSWEIVSSQIKPLRRFSIECRKSKTKLSYNTKPNPASLHDNFLDPIKNRSKQANQIRISQ